MLATAPLLVGRFVEPRVAPAALVSVCLAMLAALLLAALGLLVFLTIYLLPRPLAGGLGVVCLHQPLCTHGLPLWAQFTIWMPPVVLLGWIVTSLGRTIFRHTRSNHRVRTLATAHGRRLDVSGRFPRYEMSDGRPFAFTAGLLRPLVVVSAGLARSLTAEEMAVVVAHEEAHAARRDNLVLTFAQAAADSLFFLPGARRMHETLRRSVELGADARASEHTGDPLTVAGTVTRVAGLLTRAAGHPFAVTGAQSDMPAFSHDDLVVERVERLVFKRGQAPSRSRLVTSVVALVLVFLVVCSSGYAVGVSSLGGVDQTSACLSIPAE